MLFVKQAQLKVFRFTCPVTSAHGDAVRRQNLIRQLFSTMGEMEMTFTELRIGLNWVLKEDGQIDIVFLRFFGAQFIKSKFYL